jgi:hypothetical protein
VVCVVCGVCGVWCVWCVVCVVCGVWCVVCNSVESVWREECGRRSVDGVSGVKVV